MSQKLEHHIQNLPDTRTFQISFTALQIDLDFLGLLRTLPLKYKPVRRAFLPAQSDDVSMFGFVYTLRNTLRNESMHACKRLPCTQWVCCSVKARYS